MLFRIWGNCAGSVGVGVDLAHQGTYTGDFLMIYFAGFICGSIVGYCFYRVIKPWLK